MKFSCFLIFGFFSKCTFPVATFSLAKYLSNQLSLLIQSKLSVVVCTHKIHVFDEAFFLLPTVAMMTEMRLFLVSIATNVNETNSFNTIMKLINPNNHWRWNQTEEGYSKILLRRWIFYLIANDPDHNDGVKMSYTSVEMSRWKSIFLKSPWWSVWPFCDQNY